MSSGNISPWSLSCNFGVHVSDWLLETLQFDIRTVRTVSQLSLSLLAEQTVFELNELSLLNHIRLWCTIRLFSSPSGRDLHMIDS